MCVQEFDLTEEQRDVAQQILDAGPLCDECLGRAFGRLGRGYTNVRRGRIVREALGRAAAQPVGSCWVCGDLFERVDDWAERAVTMAQGWEYATYRFGVILTPRLEQMEAYFAERFPTGAIESLKHSVNRVLGMEFERRTNCGTVAFTEPHVSFVVDLASDVVSMDVASVYVASRYRKLVRGIPQTKWPCRVCRGRGCDACHHTGKQYAESVEEWIGTPLVSAAKAGSAILHGAGREDIDARMLGTGRPFVLELVSPHVRTLDWDRLADAVNNEASGRVQVCGFVPATRREVGRAKTTPSQKEYRARVAFDRPITESGLTEALQGLERMIEQRTPQRVAHRRADLVRVRAVHRARGRLIDEQQAEVEFVTDGGLYVKELVSGDGGRTTPNLASRLNVGAVVRELDVVGILSGDLAKALELEECTWMDSA